MLPFLKKNKEASITVTPEVITRESDHEEEYDPLESAADDLIAAVHSKNTKHVAMALRAAFQLMEDEPHHEGEHIEE